MMLAIPHPSSTRAQVLYADIPAVAARYGELTPLAISAITGLLQQALSKLEAQGGAGAAGVEARGLLEATLALLQALKQTLASMTGGGSVATWQRYPLPDMAAFLFRFVALLMPPSAAAARPPVAAGAEQIEGMLRCAAAAMDCVTDLMSKHTAGAAGAADRLLGMLGHTCSVILGLYSSTAGTAHAAGLDEGRGGNFDDALEEALLPSCVRLLVQFFVTQMGQLRRAPHHASALHDLLNKITSLTFGRR
jgi:hypothetical protein